MPKTRTTFLESMIPVALLVVALFVALQNAVGWTSVLISTLAIWALLFIIYWALRRLITGLSVTSLKLPPSEYAVLQDADSNLTSHTNKTILVLPFVNKLVAHMPGTSQQVEFVIENLNTQSRFHQTVNSIRVRVQYRIADAIAACNGLDNTRDLVKKLKDENKLEPSQIDFWTPYLARITQGKADDTIRDEIWRSKKDAVEVYRDRDDLARAALAELNRSMRAMGITYTALVFEDVNVDFAHVQRKNKDKDREVADAEHEARVALIKRKTEGEAIAHTVGSLLGSIKAQVPNISETTLQHILRIALNPDITQETLQRVMSIVVNSGEQKKG